MDYAIERINKQRLWLLRLYLLCSTPLIFNGYHIMVYNFIAYTPPFRCHIEQLENNKWTSDQIKHVSIPKGPEESSCSIIGWNYTHLATLGYEEALQFVNRSTPPVKRSCKHFVFEEEDSSTVSEWNLICDQKIGKSNIQGAIAVGKFFGGFIFGFIADKFGRKPAFVISSFMYIIFGPLAAIAHSLWFFILMRFIIGLAGSGIYETGFTILAELLGKKCRPILGCLFNLGYPTGYLSLPIISLAFPRWRDLQLAISLPCMLLLVNCWYIPESPRWLMTQGKCKRAWKIIEKLDPSLVPEIVEDLVAESSERTSHSISSKAIQVLLQLCSLFLSQELAKRTLISFFTWFVASFVYYTLALNAVNFGASRHTYMFFSGLVEFPAFVLPAVIIPFLGRKSTNFLLFLISGVALAILPCFPRGNENKILGFSTAPIIMAIAMLGRFCNVAAFSVVIVYTSELFPTTLRNTAVGSSLAMSQVGSTCAPYVVDLLSAYGWYMPSTMCAVAVLTASALIQLLPETRGRPLLDTQDDLKSSETTGVSLSNCCKFS